MSVFNKEENTSFNKEVETIIGPSVKVEGNFVSDGDIIVEGKVSGTIKTSRNLRVGEQAKVKADVEAANVYNSGEIRGNVKSQEKLDLKSTAKVFGNVETGMLSVESGAVLNGKCQMVKKEEMPVEEEVIPEKKDKKNKK